MPTMVPVALLFIALSLCVPGQGQSDFIRLVPRREHTNTTTGRLEILINNQWGTVCANLFGFTDATVACRQLGFFRGTVALNTAGNLGYPLAIGPIWLSNLQCGSFDTELADCRHSGIGVHDCDHSDDVILSCLTEGSVRLVGFSTSSATSVISPSGHLEVYINGRWGTVCGNGFSITSAQVVCQQLGFSHADRSSVSRQFPSAVIGTPILLDNVQCRSTDLTLLSCPHNGVGIHNCDHSQDVAVLCGSADPAVRLVSQTGRTSNLTGGRLEIFINNQWGTVCNNFRFFTLAADVACRQLGFPSGAIAFDNAGHVRYPLATGPIWLDDFDCSSSDTNLTMCGRRSSVTICDHSDDVILSCLSEGSLRLVSSSRTDTIISLSGRLEVYINGRWGTVCDDGFSITSAQVVCQQLGFSRAVGWSNSGAQRSSLSSPSSTDILLDNVQCRSTDPTLLSCPHEEAAMFGCSHFEDVVVFCRGPLTPMDEAGASPEAVLGGSIGGGALLLFVVWLVIFLCVAVVTPACKKRKQRGQVHLPRPSGTTTPSTSAVTAQEPPPQDPPPAIQPTVHPQGIQYQPPMASGPVAPAEEPPQQDPPPAIQPTVHPQGIQYQPPMAPDPGFPDPVAPAEEPPPYHAAIDQV